MTVFVLILKIIISFINCAERSPKSVMDCVGTFMSLANGERMVWFAAKQEKLSLMDRAILIKFVFPKCQNQQISTNDSDGE